MSRGKAHKTLPKSNPPRFIAFKEQGNIQIWKLSNSSFGKHVSILKPEVMQKKPLPSLYNMIIMIVHQETAITSRL